MPGKLNVYVSRSQEIRSRGMPAPPNRSATMSSEPHVIGLTNPAGGAGEYAALMRRIWATRVGSWCSQNLRHQRRIVWDPVTHDDPAPRARYAHHFARHVVGSRSEHRAEDADNEIEAVITDVDQVGGVPLLESAVGQAEPLNPGVACRDQVLGDIHAEHVRPEPGGGRRGGYGATAKVETSRPSANASSR